MMKPVKVIGAGLAGCEAAAQLAKRGFDVQLYEMKPNKRTPAHQSDDFAELVCSNSLRADKITNAVGLLKEEMRFLDSIVMRTADATRVPAGGALAVDREGFARSITAEIKAYSNIEIICQDVQEVPLCGPCIIASGPLTSESLAGSIEAVLGESLHFFDAAAPIVTIDSLDMSKIYRASRYGKGDDDYLNCPMTKEEYFAFYRALLEAETVQLHGFEHSMVFEGCMPVETMARRGEMTLAFGPLKPVGLKDPRTGLLPFAVVQLRQDNAQGTLFNIVGFQTNLKFAEQRRVFALIPGLKNAEYVRYGVMHRNTFLQSPGVLNEHYQVLKHPDLFFAGQMTGVEGYVESASSGLVAGLAMAKRLMGEPMVNFTAETAIGALGQYIAYYAGGDFQPMNVTYGILKPLSKPIRSKAERYYALAQNSLDRLDILYACGLI